MKTAEELTSQLKALADQLEALIGTGAASFTQAESLRDQERAVRLRYDALHWERLDRESALRLEELQSSISYRRRTYESIAAHLEALVSVSRDGHAEMAKTIRDGFAALRAGQ